MDQLIRRWLIDGYTDEEVLAELIASLGRFNDTPAERRFLMARIVAHRTEVAPQSVQRMRTDERRRRRILTARARLKTKGIAVPTQAALAVEVGISERTLREWRTEGSID